MFVPLWQTLKEGVCGLTDLALLGWMGPAGGGGCCKANSCCLITHVLKDI